MAMAHMGFRATHDNDNEVESILRNISSKPLLKGFTCTNV